MDLDDNEGATYGFKVTNTLPKQESPNEIGYIPNSNLIYYCHHSGSKISGVPK
jgi:hypothetical protein